MLGSQVRELLEGKRGEGARPLDQAPAGEGAVPRWRLGSREPVAGHPEVRGTSNRDGTGGGGVLGSQVKELLEGKRGEGARPLDQAPAGEDALPFWRHGSREPVAGHPEVRGTYNRDGEGKGGGDVGRGERGVG